MRRVFLASIALLLAIPGIAQAQPRLLSATPADKATVSKPTRLSLTFSEPLVAPLTGIDLVMTAMPGMAGHEPMPITGFQTTVSDRTVLATLPRALPAGTYLLRWHAAGADRQRGEGSYSFVVR